MTFSAKTVWKKKHIIAAFLVVITLLVNFNAEAAEKNDKRPPIPFALNLLLSGQSDFLKKGLYINGYDYKGTDYQGTVWLTASIRNVLGNYITDLTVNDVQMTEYIISKVDGTVKAEATIDMQAFASNDDENLGFFPKATGGQPVDIVFLLDATITNVSYVANLKNQITSLINEMIANHVDFRLAVRAFNTVPSDDSNYIDFYGPHEVDLLLNEVALLRFAGWQHPTTAYDALLGIPWLGFRTGARKVCVAITDIVPQTVYGAFWYTIDCTAATRTAAELFLQNFGIEFFYAQLDWDPNDIIDFYYEKDINPRAGNTSSGFSALINKAGTPLATKLSYPFDRQELKGTLGIATPLKVTDSQYLFSWKSSFDKWNVVENNGLIYHPEDYELKVTLKVPDPDQSRLGMFLEKSCTYPINKENVNIVLNVTNEEGTPYSNYGDLWAYLYHKMGGREIVSKWQLHPDNGEISVLNLPKGTYNVFICDSGSGAYSYESFRAIFRDTIEVVKDDMVFHMIVPVADQDAELYKTKGLLKDIGDWRLPGDPFQDMVDNAFVWLNTMESDGLSWEEMAAIKRFYVGLSGFANLIEYSQLEATGAVKDFENIIENFRNILAGVQQIHDNTEADWALEVLSGAIKAAMILAGQGPQYIISEKALKEALDELITYATTYLTQDLRNKIIEQLPLGDYNGLLQIIVNTLIDAAFDDNVTEPDWEPVLDAIRTITMDTAIKTVQEEVTGVVMASIDDAIKELPLTGSLTVEIKTLLKSILEALLNGDIDSNTFSQAIETFATGLADDVLTTNPGALASAVNSVFDAVDDALDNEGIDPDVSDFLVGIVRELTLLAIPKEVSGIVMYEMETDKVVNVLVKYGVYYVILKDYCIDDIQVGLEELLDGARTHVPIGDTRDWTFPMMGDFHAYRGIIGDLQGTAWDAIRVQDTINDLIQQMQELSNMLTDILEPLDILDNFSPDLKQTTENIKTLITVLDGIQILGNATSFGLKVESLDIFGDRAESMHQTLFY